MFLAGPYEFLNLEDSDKTPGGKLLSALTQAYALLDYDAGLITPEEVDLLQKERLAPPKGWQADKEVVTKTLIKGGVTVGIVGFPLPAGENGQPTREQTARVIEKAARMRREANLVIGISPWGFQAETAFLEREKDSAQFDLILGAGSGVGLRGRIMNGGQTLWTRPYSKGKSLNVVEILDVPDKSARTGWKENVNVKFEVTALKDEVAGDSRVDAVFKDIRD